MSDWQQVTEEVQYKFENEGNTFTGIFHGTYVKGSIPQATFTGTGDYHGEEYFINLGRDLDKKLAKVPVDAEVKITRTADLDTGHESGTYMMTFDVQWRRLPKKSSTFIRPQRQTEEPF